MAKNLDLISFEDVKKEDIEEDTTDPLKIDESQEVRILFLHFFTIRGLPKFRTGVVTVESK